tara:strand:- start:975 stop:1973 length:999 start_codon:yes stop_codon:yes gene_type:complete
MAETNFQPKSSIEVGIGNGSANLGTAHANSDTWNFLQVTDFTFDQSSAPIEVAPSKNSLLGQLESQGHHRRDNIMYEATLTMRGTPTAVLKSCLALFGDGASEASLTPGSNTNNNSGGKMIHGAANVNAVTLLFENAGSDATNIDVSMPGCFATSMTMRQDVGTNGGEMVVETSFVSGYQPVESAFAAPNSKTLDTDAPKNIFDIATSTLDAEALVLNSWEITISRELARIGFQDSTNYQPFGYAQIGPYEVTGQLVAKRDDSVHDFAAHASGDSTGIVLALANSSGFTIDCQDVMIDNTKPDMGGEYLLQTIPFRAFAAGETSEIIGITIS